MEKIKSVLEKLSKNYFFVMIVPVLISIIILLLQFKFKNAFWFFSILTMIISIFSYFSINFMIEGEENQLKAVGLFKLNIYTTAVLLVNTVLVGLLSKNYSTILPFACLIVNIFVFVCVVYVLNQPITKLTFTEIKDTNIFVLMGINFFQRKLNVGDVVLCKNIDTKQDVIMPCKDRFLHMLVLGPTGSGKTSQIILPMLNQDMQNMNAGVTVIEPKGDLAEKAYAMAQYYGRPAIYFNPILESCPTFNPLGGKEEDIIENMATTFKMLNPDAPQYFQDMGEQLLRNALKVLKRLKGDNANLIDLSRLLSNAMGQGRNMVTAFVKMKAENEAIRKENDDIANYFLSDYFNEKSKTYENTSGIRSQVAKIVSNKFLRKVLNPEGRGDINFDKHLEEGTIICISTAQGTLRDLGSFLGYFIILSFQSSVFKRPGNENTRRHHFLYIDEFQTYSNPGFADMLTQGRSYRVASHLATQNRALIGMGSGKDGDNFIELVSTNARNVVIFPGGNYNDAKYYSDQFGEIDKLDHQVGVSRQKFSPIYMSGGRAPTETERVMETTEARYSPTDIIYRKFGEITYMIIQDNTLQSPGVGKVAYIDKDLNSTLDKMVSENNKMMSIGINPNLCRDFSQNGILKKNLNWQKVEKDYEIWDKKTNYGIDIENEEKERERVEKERERQEENKKNDSTLNNYMKTTKENDASIDSIIEFANSDNDKEDKRIQNLNINIDSNVNNNVNLNNSSSERIIRPISDSDFGDEEEEDIIVSDKKKNTSDDNIDIDIEDDDDMI